MVEHVTVWCLTRTGSTAYCNHLENTGVVQQSKSMEIFNKQMLFPCFRQPNIDILLHHLPLDNTVPENFTGEWIQNNYNPDWVWIRYVEDGNSIYPAITDSPVTQYEIDKFYNITMRKLRHTPSKHVVKVYEDQHWTLSDFDYDTQHHLLIRDPVDITLSREFAKRTKVWHLSPNEKNPKIDFKLDFSQQDLYINLKHTIESQLKLESKCGVFSKIVRYEDLKMNNNKYKKVWSLEQKLEYVLNLDEALEKVKDELNY